MTGTGFAQIINNRAMVIVDTCESPGGDRCAACRGGKRACTGAAPPETEHSGVLSFQSIAGARDVAPQGREKRPSDRILRRKMVLCKVPAGLREKKRLSRPAGTLLLCAWEEKRAVRGSGNEKPARETRKETDFGSGREKECRQTRRKPKCSHVSQKNRRLYAKTGLQREKVLCRPVLILCTTSANND